MNTNTMTRISTLAVAIGLAFSANSWAADDTATQTVGYEVQEIALIDVSGSPAAMTITAAPAGQAPTPATDATTTYSITNNAGTDSKKITAAINTDMPTGVTLEVELGAPTGATATKQALSSAPANVVTGIDNVSETGKSITYTLSATAAAGKVTSANKTVTFTITNS